MVLLRGTREQNVIVQEERLALCLGRRRRRRVKVLAEKGGTSRLIWYECVCVRKEFSSFEERGEEGEGGVCA